jgi:hypothetical protein
MEPESAADAHPACFVHAGTHKTGTTAIQRFLAGNGEALARAGLYYPQAGRRSGALPGHHGLVAELRSGAHPSPDAGTLAAVTAEIARVRPERACLSAEGFSALHEREDALVALRDALAAIGYRPRVVLYVRAQDEYAESFYAELVKHGLTRSAAEFFDGVMQHGVVNELGRTYRFAYGPLVDRFASVFGDDAMIVRGYRDVGRPDALVLDFLAAVGVAERLPPGSVVHPAAYDNVRLSTGAVIAGLFANTAALLGDDGFAKAGAELVARHAADAREPFRPLAPHERERMTARFADENARLVARWNVEPPPFERRRTPRPESEPTRRARALFARAEAIRAERLAQANGPIPMQR